MAANKHPLDKARMGRCAVCGKDIVHAFRPFCSRRCADIDLARWLGGGYVISGTVDADEDGGAGAAGAGSHETKGAEDEE